MNGVAIVVAGVICHWPLEGDIFVVDTGSKRREEERLS